MEAASLTPSLMKIQNLEVLGSLKVGKHLVCVKVRLHKLECVFGCLKNQAALDYECLNLLANGAKVCVGGQLHPQGRLDAATYGRIGKT